MTVPSRRGEVPPRPKRRGILERSLIRQSQEYWQSGRSPDHAANSHWNGAGPFRTPGLWEALGALHLRLYQDLQRFLGCEGSPRTVVEWGCGGGMNAVKFAPLATRLLGVEISQASLRECEAQVRRLGLRNFEPIPIHAARPREAVDRIGALCDFFLCTYVFELLPSRDYAVEILRIAHDVMREGGSALVQFRYRESTRWVERLPRRYRNNVAGMTTFTLEEFWVCASTVGLEPLYLTLVPNQPELKEERYAYCALRKETSG